MGRGGRQCSGRLPVASKGVRVWRIPYSTNVERVALALAHKGLAVEWVDVHPADRSEVVRVSGQELVPVLEHDGGILSDSPRILEFLEERYPEPPLLPPEPARRAEIRVFCDWFNRVWKRPPNEIYAEEQKPKPDPAQIERLGSALGSSLPLFDDLLAGRDFLFGELSLADVTAFPFLKYALLWEEGDDERFHELLREQLALDGRYERLASWIRRMDDLPRA